MTKRRQRKSVTLSNDGVGGDFDVEELVNAVEDSTVTARQAVESITNKGEDLIQVVRLSLSVRLGKYHVISEVGNRNRKKYIPAEDVKGFAFTMPVSTFETLNDVR